MGAWRFAKPRLDTAMRELLPPHERPAELRTLRYVGRPAAASPGAPAWLLRRCTGASSAPLDIATC